MAGPMDIAASSAGSFMDAMKREPLSLALVLMNLCLLLFFYVILTRVADQRKEEIGLLYADKKEVRELLAKCVVPDRRTDTGAVPSDMFQLPIPIGPPEVKDASPTH